MVKINRAETVKLVACAMAVVEMDSPSKREYLKFMCNKYNVDSEKFFEDVEAMVREYENLLPKKSKDGYQR